MKESENVLTNKKLRARISRHEAAHAVVAYVMGWRVGGLRLSKDGGCTLVKSPAGYPWDPLRDAAISLAGVQAESGKPTGEPLRPTGSDDEVTRRMPMFDNDVGLYGETYRIAAIIAKSLVEKHWDAVSRVARALNASKSNRLTAKQFRRVVDLEKGCFDEADG